MSHHLPYPTTPPVECIKDALRIYREGKIGEEQALFTKHLWMIESYALNIYPGEPDQPHIIADGPPDENVDALVIAALDPTTAIDPQMIPWNFLLQFLKSALEAWLNN